MKIRLNVNEHGHTHLQQLLQVMSPDGDKLIEEWEVVPTTGAGLTASYSLPLNNSVGVFIFEEEIEQWKSYSQEGMRFTKISHIINALAVIKVSESDSGRLLVHTAKNKFFIKSDIISFINILTEALSKFMIVTIDSSYNIKEISYGNKIEDSPKKREEDSSQKNSYQKQRTKNGRPRASKRESTRASDRISVN